MTIENGVATNLGSESGAAEDRGFDHGGDLCADADGWLIGKELRAGMPTFGEAWRSLLVSAPTPQLRIRRFNEDRFGPTTPSKLRSALEGC